MPTTTHGVPYPDPFGENDVPGHIRALAQWVDAYVVRLAQLGVAGGVASLDGTGKIPTAQLPAIAVNDSFAAASQTAMLALDAQPGDVAMRTDLSKRFLLLAAPASTLSNWHQLREVTDGVSSVDGRSGNVTLSDLYLSKAGNLGDLPDPEAARGSLGLGSAATRATGTAPGQVPVLGAGGRLDIARVASGAPTGQKFVRDDGTLAVPGLLDAVAVPTGGESTSATALGDVAPTTLRVVFIAPASGRVLVRLSGFHAATGDTTVIRWGLRNGTDEVLPAGGSGRGVPVSASLKAVHAAVPFLVEALTPGTTYTLKWAYCVDGSGGAAATFAAGGVAVMEAWTA